MFSPIFRKALVVAVVTVLLDFLFHYFATRPMEVLTYFVIKFLLAFFVAVGMFSSIAYLKNKTFVTVITGFIFSILMSIYYRAWELGEAHVPFGARAPDIIGISRDNLILFSGIWLIGHALFFVVGVLAAEWMEAKNIL